MVRNIVAEEMAVFMAMEIMVVQLISKMMFLC